MKINNEKLAQLYQDLADAKEHHEVCIMVRDWNMLKAWEEQIEILNEKIKKEMKNEFGSK